MYSSIADNSSNYKLLKQKAEALRLFISTRVAPKEKQELKQRAEKIYNRLSEKGIHYNGEYVTDFFCP